MTVCIIHFPKYFSAENVVENMGVCGINQCGEWIGPECGPVLMIASHVNNDTPI